MVAVLRRDGVVVNRKRVRRLMRLMGLEAIYQKPNTSAGHPEHKVYPICCAAWRSSGQRVWCADITYIPMAKGFVYLVAVMDWFSRRVLSWRLSITMEADFCVEALQEAISSHGPPAIFNTDQGVQFTSAGFLEELEGCEHPDQHGWQGAVPGQHLHRAAVAQPQIRGHLHQGVWIGAGGACRDRRLAEVLQR